MIDNPILNSPFEEPTRHFKVVDGKFTEEVANGRRASSYLIPVAKPRGRSSQLALPGTQTEEVKPNEAVNEIRSLVRAWRENGYPGVTQTTRTLLNYWKNERRPSRLFFAQIEAVETAIYVTEWAPKNRPDILNRLDAINAEENDGLPRAAFKMATGTGKTVVMGMLIAWHVLNKADNPADKRFSDAFLIVTPGITIRDRLRVLQPEEPDASNYYIQRDLVPPDLRDRLLNARIAITNYHTFSLRDTLDAAKLNKQILGGGIMETPGAMVRRVLRDLGNKKNVIVLNDEAHHCYLARERDAESGEEAKAARVWLQGLKYVQEKVGVRAIYDLSATPFYLSSSGRPEGTLFEWVVSDFDLTDAIESGLVKIPHVPVADDTASEEPKYRAIWANVKDELKQCKAARKDDDKAPPLIPGTLEGALKSLYSDYERAFHLAEESGSVPPVFVVVCDDTRTSKLLTDWIAGYDGPDGPISGNLPLFSNVSYGEWLERPRTLLIDSAQLESGDALSGTFKTAAKREIEEFRDAYKKRTGRNDIDDAKILREVMNTVGKRGQLGEHIRCVVSVSMLSEGWDVNSVTHILGVRAFSTKLLCEQVIGRGLRRMSYDVTQTPDGERFAAEYAEVYGVPFDFYPAQGGKGKAHTKDIHVVEALPGRQADMEITFPIVVNYRRESRPPRLEVTWPEKRFPISRKRFDIAQETIVQAYVGTEKTIEYNPEARERTLVFKLAQAVMERHFIAPDGNEESWYFPQVLRIVEDWMQHQALFEDADAMQLFDVAEVRNAAADDIAAAIDRSAEGKSTLRAEIRRWDGIGTTTRVRFETTKDVIPTTRSHVNYVVCDSGWEGDMVDILESIPEVKTFVKNHGLGFVIPYVFDTHPHAYFPDFIVVWHDEHGTANVIVEVTGERNEKKIAKTETARDRWVPAVNNTGKWGEWAFVEVQDLSDAAALIRAKVQEHRDNYLTAKEATV
jgi:type III restriction enzyme